MMTDYSDYFRQRAELRAPFPVLTQERLLFIEQFFKAPYNWRHEAEYLMTWMLHAMLLAPLSEGNASNNDFNGYTLPDHIDAAEFYGKITSDLQALISRANTVAQRKGHHHVTANCVVVAIGEMAAQPQAGRLSYWQYVIAPQAPDITEAG